MLLRNNLGAIAFGCVASAAVVLLLPGLQPWFDAHLFSVRWTDVAVAIGSLGLLSILACYLSARPLLSQAPAVTLSEAGR